MHSQNMGNAMMQQKMMASNMQMQQGMQQHMRMPQQQQFNQAQQQQFAQQQFNPNQQQQQQQFAQQAQHFNNGGQQQFGNQSQQFSQQQQFNQSQAGMGQQNMQQQQQPMNPQQQQQTPQQPQQPQQVFNNSQQQAASGNSGVGSSNNTNSDFGLEFLDNIPGDSGGQFGSDAQELLNSFDNGVGFSLLDTLWRSWSLCVIEWMIVCVRACVCGPSKCFLSLTTNWMEWRRPSWSTSKGQTNNPTRIEIIENGVFFSSYVCFFFFWKSSVT